MDNTVAPAGDVRGFLKYSISILHDLVADSTRILFYYRLTINKRFVYIYIYLNAIMYNIYYNIICLVRDTTVYSNNIIINN